LSKELITNPESYKIYRYHKNALDKPQAGRTPRCEAACLAIN